VQTLAGELKQQIERAVFRSAANFDSPEAVLK